MESPKGGFGACNLDAVHTEKGFRLCDGGRHTKQKVLLLLYSSVRNLDYQRNALLILLFLGHAVF